VGSRKWTYADLYEKLGITAKEISFIEKAVCPLNVNGTTEDE
jgi:hypothetical protein